MANHNNHSNGHAPTTDSPSSIVSNGEEKEQGAPCWKFWRRRRYLIAFLAFCGFFNVYALRVNLSVAIVAMTTNYTVHLENGTVIHKRDFDWDSTTQGLVLSSFFYGYLITQVPGGWLAARIGGHRVFAVGIAVTAFLTLLTPPLANASVYLLIAVRVIEGIFEGVTFPSIHAIWSRWAPPLERSRLATMAFSGSYAGTVISLPLSAIIGEQIGWPYIFYFFGVLGLIWCCVWWLIVKEAPEFDPNISPHELKYIQDSLGGPRSDADKLASHPWRMFLTSLPVWAIVVAHFSENWGFYTLLTQLPTFMKDVLQFKLEKAGFMSALPYLVMVIVLQFAGHLADWLQTKGYLTTTGVRKAYTCGAFISQMVFMMMAAFLLTPAGAVTCLTMAVGLGAFAWSGFGVNHLDVSPKHASVLMGLSNTVATLPGIVSPAITGYIVRNKDVQEWQIVFYIASAIYLFGAVFYYFFASGNRQSWAEDKPSVTKPIDGTNGTNGTAYVNNGAEIDYI